MTRLSTLLWPALLLPTLALAQPGGDECSILEAAHRKLLNSSFTCERHFTLELNGEIAAREVTRLSYETGELAREVVTREVLRKGLVLEEGASESALALAFDCERVVRTGDRVKLTNAEETEEVVFVLEGEKVILRPSQWSNSETERFLWKKLEIEATASYRDFEWRTPMH